MSDECSVDIFCRREDAKLFERFGVSYESGCILKRGELCIDSLARTESAIVKLSMGEVNYAARVGDLKDGFGHLPKGLIYYGSHGPGSQYGDGLFATLGDTLDYARALCYSTSPAVELDPSGRLNRRSLRVARKYLATLAKVQRLLIEHLRKHSPELCRSRVAKPSLQRRTDHE